MCLGAVALQLVNEKSYDIWHKFDNKNVVAKKQTGKFALDIATLVS